MRFMVIVKASKESEAGKLPSAQLLADMGKFNEELTKAGIMLAGEGLQASSKGARVKFVGDKRIADRLCVRPRGNERAAHRFICDLLQTCSAREFIREDGAAHGAVSAARVRRECSCC